MLILYDLNKTKIAGLKNYKDLRVERELSGDEVLFFSYPQIDPKHDSIKEETYVRTKKNEFVVKEVNIKDDWTEFVAKVNVEDLKGKAVNSFETVEQTCTNAVNLAIDGTGWTIGLCDVLKKRTVRKSNCSSYDILQEIKKVYLCDFKFDAINKKVYIYQSMGSDKGTYFSDKLNLKKLDIQSNSYDFCTRIIPIGKDGLKINNINSGKEYVENYQYSNKVITVFWEDNRYTVVENLKEDATAKLNELSKPIRAYSAEIFDLANLNDKYRNILDYDLGDTITLLSKDKKVKEKQRIVKIIEYPDEPERNSCEIANRTLSFEDIQADTLEAVDTVNSVTTSDGMIDNSKVDFNPLRLEVVSLVAQKADIGELNAAVARIGTLEATTATISQLNAAVARIGVLEVGSATVTQLNAANAKIATLETRAASIDTLLAGNLTADNMKANLITAGTTLIADGSIASAKIISLSADKINAGKINTNLVTIQSSSGNMIISDNTIQIKDSTRVRVQIGKDASNDYNMYVWDSTGNLMFDATGLKASGIKSKIIRDDMVSDTANINATKIEKESLVTRINGATTLLLASKVKLDTENQTLEVAFNSLKSTVTTTANTVTSQGTSISTIQGQIQAKIWQQDITSATNSLDTRISSTETSIIALNSAISLKVSTSDFTTYQGTVTNSLNNKANQSALNTTNGNVNNLTTRVTSAESSISVLQNQISLKVEQSDIITAINNISIGGRNLILESNFDNLTKWTRGTDWGKSTEVYKNNNVMECDRTYLSVSTTAYSDLQQTIPYVKLELNVPYTISFYVKCTANGTKPLVWYLTSITGTSTDNNWAPITATTDWIKVSRTITFTTKPNELTPIMYLRVFNGHKVAITKPKFEKGTKDTDWSPAPEDQTAYTDTQISTAKAEIKVTTDSISSTVSSVQSSVTSLGTRVTSAESSIISLNNSITLKVNTSDFNSYKTTNDSAVNSKASQASLNTTNSNLSSLTTRVTNTESSISVLQDQISLKVSTTDFSTYQTTVTNNLNSKANQSSLDTTNSNVTTAQNTANAKRRVFTATPTTPYDVGDLWVTTNGTGDLKTCKTARASGAYNASDWVKGVKYTDDTTANAVQANLNTTNDNVTAITTRISTAESTITQLSNSIALRVETSTYNTKMTSLDGSITSLTSRVSAAELKITDSSIVSTVRSSTAYTSDLAAKANQSALNTTNTNVSSLTTRVSSTESSITQLSTQIQSKVNIGDFGTLITQNVNSVRIAVGQIGWNNLIKNGDFELDTNLALEYNRGTWGITQATQMYGWINPSLNNRFLFANSSDSTTNPGIMLQQTKTRVQAGKTYTVSFDFIFDLADISKLSSLEFGINIYTSSGAYLSTLPFSISAYSPYRGNWGKAKNTFTIPSSGAYCNFFFGFNLSSAVGAKWLGVDALKLEEGENASAYSPNVNEINNVSVDISDAGLTVRNGAISILNNAGNQVLSGDTNGNLTIRGDFTTYDDTTGNMAMRLSKRSTFYYDYDSNAICGEVFAGKIVNNGSQRGMVFGAYRNKFLQLSYQGTDNNMYGVLTVDNGALGNTGTISITSGKQINTQNLYVSGSKNCIQETENYGKRLLYAYETTESYLGDFVHGKINENGECVISIDEIFGECVNTDIQYHVFTQTYKGSITEIELYPNYFIVKGEAGTFFSCEIKAKRKGFEHVRLEQKFVEEHGVESIEDELKSLVSSDIDEELYGDLADELLEV